MLKPKRIVSPCDSKREAVRLVLKRCVSGTQEARLGRAVAVLFLLLGALAALASSYVLLLKQ